MAGGQVDSKEARLWGKVNNAYLQGSYHPVVLQSALWSKLGIRETTPRFLRSFSREPGYRYEVGLVTQHSEQNNGNDDWRASSTVFQLMIQRRLTADCLLK